MMEHSPLFDDVRAMGAALLPDVTLVRLLLGEEVPEGEAMALVGALALSHDARRVALLEHPKGPVILAALELGRRAILFPPPTHVRITGPADVVSAVRPLLNREPSALLVALDEDNQIARCARLLEVEGGDLAPREVLGPALSAGCRRFVLLHHRPRAVAAPSPQDVASTRRLERLARVLGLTLVDHLITSVRAHCSLLREGFVAKATPGYR